MAQFTDHQPQTAHSSMMLILGETGVPGLLFWTALMYAAFKITLTILRRERSPEAQPARVWSSALLACLTGFSVSAMFLSLTYHYLLWILLGLVGALYAATKRHDARLQIKFGLLDLAAVVAIDVVFVVATTSTPARRGSDCTRPTRSLAGGRAGSATGPPPRRRSSP